MEIRFSNQGIHLPALDLWLDPRHSVERAWISHAHADHAQGYHRETFGTPITLDLYRQRWPADPAQPQELRPLGFEDPMALGDATLTALPAAHILGAAMLAAEHEGHRLVYTGDVKLRAPLCGAATRMAPCDTLIIESTFGLPLFQFLEREEAARRIADFAKACLGRGEMPVFLGYPLGRGQELAHVLGEAGIPTLVHGAIAKYFPTYERAGYSFGDWLPYEREAKGRALVTVPAHVRYLPVHARVAAVSGWASLHNARLRYQASELIPYSDHGDFAELLELVRQSGARRVYVVHGYAEAFARYLRDRLGLEAQAALGADQQREEAAEEA